MNKGYTLSKLGVLTVFIMALSQNVRAEQDATQLNLFNYFNQDVFAWGIFEARFGDLKREFKVLIQGDVSGNTLVLNEYFIYADGERQTRIWRITKNDDNTYTGEADDVIGLANGVVTGNTLTWEYKLDLKTENNNVVVHFDDRMYLNDDGMIINRAIVTKWGIKIGEVSLFFAPASLVHDATAMSKTFEEQFTKH